VSSNTGLMSSSATLNSSNMMAGGLISQTRLRGVLAVVGQAG
jgi:hypothetical protein